jgi:hypothetical protein
MNIKYYKVKHVVPDLIDIGERFVLINEKRLYRENSTIDSAYLSIEQVNRYKGLNYYFEECEPFHFPLLENLVEEQKKQVAIEID